MTEHNTHDGTDGAPPQRDRAGGIARAAAAVAAGVAMGWANRDVGLGVTTAAVAMDILRAVSERSAR